MIPLRIAVCEDIEADSALMEQLLEKSGVLFQCSFFRSGEEFLSDFAHGKYDIVFLDIYMGGMLGVEAARKLREMDSHVVIAFTTTSTEHTLASYRVGALQYIEKPVTLKAVQRALELALSERKTRETITLMMDGSEAILPLDTVLYFEQKQHNVNVCTIDGIHKTSRTVKLTDIEKQIKSPPFIRTHYSYIANLRYVSKIDRELMMFVMKNDHPVYIRRENFGKARDAFENYLFADADA